MTAIYEPGGPASDWDDATMCECGRGPMRRYKNVADRCCIQCLADWLESLCDEHGEADCEECAP